MARISRTALADASSLAGLSGDDRERLRRAVLVSTGDDYSIAQKLGCLPLLVQSMRRRLQSLGVLARAEPAHAPAPRPPRGGASVEVQERRVV